MLSHTEEKQEEKQEGKKGENQKKEPIIKTAVVGFLVGIGAVAPGISGGAIAVVFGLYEKITTSIAMFYKDFWKNMRFLIPLGIGAVAGILLFADIIVFLFDHFEMQVKGLFVGLMAGTLPSLFKTAKSKKFAYWYIIPMLAAAGLTIFLTMSEGLQYTGDVTQVPFYMLLICGAILGIGTIVPGVSSSFLLMSVGLYESVMAIINQRDIMGLIPLGIGFCLCFLMFSKIITWLYKKAHGLTSFIVLGLLLGSIVPIFPALGWNTISLLTVCLMLGGAAGTYLLMRYSRHRQEDEVQVVKKVGQ